MRNPTAFTIVEVLVALIVFTVAALGSAGTLSVAFRTNQTVIARRLALNALQSQASAMTDVPCASISAGGSVSNGVALSWTADVADSLARVVLAAEFRGTHTTLRTEFKCL
jgi:type II secretory pathway pseudopilin PulG